MTNAALLGTYGDVSGQSLMFRNKLINGDIKIDQRANGGSAVSNTTGSNYIADRFVFDGASSSKFTGQRSAIAPVGFATSMSFTSSAATTVGSTDYYRVMQHIEGQNIADLAWGTASAKTVTLSFYVYASAAGTYSGAVRNGSSNRSYPFTYSVSAVNTWEYKTIVIPGDTTGTWATDNTLGMSIILSLGCGSTRVGTAGSWSANNYMGATGETQVVATNGANIRFCGLQLEAGSVATPFEQRPYGLELLLCQRYYHLLAVAHCMTSENGRCLVPPAYPILRGVPTVSIVNIYNGETGTSLGTNVAVSVGTNGAGYTATGFGNILWRGMAGISYSAEL